MKIKLFRHPAIFLLLLLCITVIAGCSSLIAQFDQAAYEQDTSLKVDSVGLMGKATEPYAQHEKEIAGGQRGRVYSLDNRYITVVDVQAVREGLRMSLLQYILVFEF